jgi:ketosteroid isomerase-like protein
MAMSEDDVGLVREAIKALNERDHERVLELLDPEVELATAKAVLEGTKYHGHEGFQRYLSEMEEDWAYFDYELEELTGLGDGLVLVAGRFRARGRDTGTEVESPGAWLCRARDGRIVGVHFHGTADAARAAADELARR